jgi:hypothetical protein
MHDGKASRGKTVKFGHFDKSQHIVGGEVINNVIILIIDCKATMAKLITAFDIHWPIEKWDELRALGGGRNDAEFFVAEN